MKRVYEEPAMNVVVFETEDIMDVLPQTSTGIDDSQGEGNFDSL